METIDTRASDALRIEPNFGEAFQTVAEFDETHGLLLEKYNVGGHRVDRELAAGVQAFAARGVAGGAYLFDQAERRTCQAMLDFWATQAYSSGYDIGHPRLVKFDPDRLPQLDDAKCPYVGLRAFTESDRRRYRGRDQETRQLVAKIGQEPLVIVTGASGSGKSSLVFAGALPALKEGVMLPGSASWRYCDPVLPGRDPLRRLALSVLPSLNETELQVEVAAFQKDSKHLLTVLDQSPRSTLVIVDQFEEVFTLQTPETREQYEAFVANLVSAADSAAAKHRVVLTMRSDVQAKVTIYPALHRRYPVAAFPVSEMGQAGLREAIEEPAQSVGLKFQRGVVDTIVKSMVGEENNPPLLQFAMTELWRNRRGNIITDAALRQLGNVKLALPRAAQALWDSFGEAQRLAADRIFLKLAREGEGSGVYRNRVLRSELLEVADPADVAFVVKQFADANLLRITRTDATRPDEDLIEVVHEALLRNWPRINQLIAERDALRDQRASLVRWAETWRDNKFAAGYLLDGLALKEANEKFGGQRELGHLVGQFLAASTKADKEAERAQASQLRWKLSLATSAAVILAILANNLWEQRQELKTANRDFVSREAAAEARKLAQRDPILGVLLAQAGYEHSPTPQALGAWYGLTWLTQLRPVATLTKDKLGDVEALVLSTDGSHLFAAGDRKVRQWKLGATPAIAATFEGFQGRAQAIASSADGKKVALIARRDDETAVYYRDASASQPTFTKLRADDVSEFQRLAFNSDGTRLVAIPGPRDPEERLSRHRGSEGNSVALWNLEPLSVDAHSFNLPNRAVAANFLNTSNTLAVLLSNGELRKGQVNADGKMGALRPIGERCDFRAEPRYSLSPQSFVAYVPAVFCLNKFASRETDKFPDYAGDLGQGVKLSPDGNSLALMHRWSRAISIIGVDSGFERRLPNALDLNESPRFDRTFVSRAEAVQLSNGGHLATTRSDGSVSIYDLGRPAPWPSIGRGDEFAPSGNRYAMVIERGRSVPTRVEVREWPTKTLTKWEGAANEYVSLRGFTRDGRLLAIMAFTGQERVHVIDLERGKTTSYPADSLSLGESSILLRRRENGSVILEIVNGEKRAFNRPVLAPGGDLIAEWTIRNDADSTLTVFHIVNGRFSKMGEVVIPNNNPRPQFDASGRFFLTETLSPQKQVMTQVWQLSGDGITQGRSFPGRYAAAVADREGRFITANRVKGPVGTLSLLMYEAATERTGVVMNLQTGDVTEIERTVHISRSGRHLVRQVEGSEGLEIVEVSVPENKMPIAGHPKLEFSRNDELLAAVYQDAQVLTLYDVSRKRAIAEIPIEGIVEARFDATGANMIVTTSTSKELIPVSIDALRRITGNLAGGRKLTDRERCDYLRDDDACKVRTK